jgi:predicted amidohydrolase YtcJ
LESAVHPDLVVLADTVHTLEEPCGTAAHRSPTAVAVRDGVIAAVGTRDDVRDWRGRNTEVIDLGAAVLTPGLTDAHSHPVMGLQLAQDVDLSAARDLDGVRARLAAAAAGRPPDAWVLGWGLDHNVFGGRRPSAAQLEEALGHRPALVRMLDVHSAVATARALAIAGVSGPRRFAERAQVVCDDADRPTGLLLEAAAIDLVQAVVPLAAVGERRDALLTLLARMAATGLTGAHVMDMLGDTAAVVSAAEESADLPLRLRFAPWCPPGADAGTFDALIAAQGTGGRRWTVGGVKLMIDGTVDNGTAWLEEPDCFGESTAAYWLDPDAYTRAVRTLAGHGVPTATHAIGDAAVRHVLAALEAAPATAAGPHRIEHLETLPAELVPAFVRQNVVASMQPTHCSRYVVAAQTDNWSVRLGPRRARRAWRCRDLHEAGVPVALGSDWPVAPFDARAVLADAQLRRPAGRPGIAPVVPAQALTARMALQGYTTHAAHAAGASRRSGRIAPGLLADLTAFTVDPLRADPDELAHAPIAMTVVAGSVVHRDSTV